MTRATSPRRRSVEVSKREARARPGAREGARAAARVERQGRRVGVGPVGRRDEPSRRLRVPVEERRAQHRAVDRRRERAANACVVERGLFLVDDHVREVRAGSRRDRQARLRGRARRQERRRDEVQRDVGAARFEAERTRILVVHHAERHGARRARKRAAGGRHEPHFAARRALDHVRTEAVERTVGRRRRRRLVGPQDRELEIREQRRVRSREANDHRVLALFANLGDRVDHARVARRRPRAMRTRAGSPPRRAPASGAPEWKRTSSRSSTSRVSGSSQRQPRAR